MVFYFKKEKLETHNLWKNSKSSKLARKCLCAFCVQKNGGISSKKMEEINRILKVEIDKNDKKIFDKQFDFIQNKLKVNIK